MKPVAEVLWYEPELHDKKGKGHKIIDATMSFMEAAPVGTQLYTADQLKQAKVEVLREAADKLCGVHRDVIRRMADELEAGK